MLLDVGVWLSAIWNGHSRHVQVAEWFNQQEETLVFCRVTHMSLLRLLSNPAVMGADTLTRADAWRIVDHLLDDERVRQATEPAQLEHTWRAISARNDHSHKLWADDYLAAFAQTASLALVTLDTALARRYPSITVHTLG